MKRMTLQRRAILGAILSEDRPLRIAEILEMGRDRVPSLDQATVYRNLNRMVEEGEVRRLTHPTLGTLFEQTGKRHHHHFHCRSCDRLYDLPGCGIDESRLTPPGFSTEAHDFYLYGVCAGCKGG